MTDRPIEAKSEFGAVANLFDVVEVKIAAPHAERVMARGLTEADAGWFINMAIARRGVEHQFYVARAARSRVLP